MARRDNGRDGEFRDVSTEHDGATMSPGAAVALNGLDMREGQAALIALGARHALPGDALIN
jgi:hypothetical protein